MSLLRSWRERGGTTDELERALTRTLFLPRYDFVTLLIGVNNEYRGRDLHEFSREFALLLRRAIGLAGERADRVFVLSIPDWGISPFAGSHLPDDKGRDAAMVGAEIDAFNAAAAGHALRKGVGFIDITPHSRSFAGQAAAFASDGLHPGGVQYKYWAEKVVERISLSKISQP